MAHDHHDIGSESYYLEQLCSIGISGAIGLVMCLLWHWGGLFFLAPKFRLPVLLGGIVLVVVATIRGVAVWIAVGKQSGAVDEHNLDHHHDHHHHHHDHACDHDHGPGCDHSHERGAIVAAQGNEHVHAAEHAHGHGALGHVHEAKPHFDHDHDHGWAPWRYAVLIVPVILFLLNIPPRSPGEDNDLEDDSIPYLNYSRVERAANDAQERKDLEGERGHLKGQLGYDPRQGTFTLIRKRVTCCGPDAVKVHIILLPPEGQDINGMVDQWVDIAGVIGFTYTGAPGQPWITIVRVEKIRKLDGPLAAPFIF
jgi:hypothetical protein